MLWLFAYWVILHASLSSADFFQKQRIRKFLSGIPSECQTVWVQIRPDVLSGLFWVQTVCKDYQQTMLVVAILLHRYKGGEFGILGKLFTQFHH